MRGRTDARRPSKPGGIDSFGVEPPELDAATYEAFRRFIHERIGISLGANRQQMLLARLSKRIRKLALADARAYLKLLRELADDDPEFQAFVNAVTTNKTEFFREDHHFRFVAERWTPEFLARVNRGGQSSVRVWSACCSTGEEPYSLAMTLREACGGQLNRFDIKILATDIDTDVLTRASTGAYCEESLEAVPREQRSRWFHPAGAGPRGPSFQVDQKLRDMILFRRLNLMEAHWPIKSRLDFVFCRNALIYFDRPTQHTLLERFSRQLLPGGYLILGHSENLIGLEQRFERSGPTIFRLRNGAEPTTRSPGRPKD